MKPNDKAIKALSKIIEDRLPDEGGRGISEFERQVFVNDMAVDGLTAAYAAQFQSEEYAGLVKELRSERGCIASPDDCLAAADALEAVLAERDAANAEKQKWWEAANDFDDDANATLWSDIADEQHAEYKKALSGLIAVTAERDALLACLAPVDDEELVKIAANAICVFVHASPDNKTEYHGQARAVIATIRPHIEAAERERCVKRILETNWVDADPEAIAAAIRSGK